MSKQKAACLKETNQSLKHKIVLKCNHSFQMLGSEGRHDLIVCQKIKGILMSQFMTPKYHPIINNASSVKKSIPFSIIFYELFWLVNSA